MNYSIRTIPNLDKQAKRLSKKYPSLKSDLSSLLDVLSLNPNEGKSLGKNCYKVRMPISSKNKGKSGGARVITCVFVLSSEIYLLDIYDKSEKENISEKELKHFVSQIQ